MFAVMQGHVACVMLLQSEHMIRNIIGKTALHYACYFGNIECAQLLLDDIAIISKNGQSALEAAKRATRDGLHIEGK